MRKIDVMIVFFYFIYFLMFYYEKDTLKDSDKNYEVTRIINIVFVHTLHPN